jgi:ABC-type sugar transport system ATPase subunit
LLDAIGAAVNPDHDVASLPVAEQQLVQIAAAVGANAGVIVFDEPTSSLGERETARLYEVIASLRGRGTTVIYVSHRMAEIFALADTVTVLRDGRHVGTRPAADLDEATLVEFMIGRRIEQFFPAEAHATRGVGQPVLEVSGLSAADYVRDMTFTLRAGEVVGLAGLVGAGRSEVARALFGLDSRASGTVRVRGRDAAIRKPRDAMALGIAYVPEDRKAQGLVLSLRNRENGSLASLERHARRGWVNRAAEEEAVRGAFARSQLDVELEMETRTLSGGNQQKVVLAKWLAAGGDILLLDEPTRGVDVGAKAELHQWIHRHAASGGAVLLISSELPELLNLCTRIIVLREGRVVGELSRAEATQERVLRMMSGMAAA